MNQIKLTKIIQDLKEDLQGLHWAVTGNTAYQILTENDPSVIDIDLVMDLQQYPEAALRLNRETDTFIDDSGVKVFELKTTYRDVPIVIRTTNFEHKMNVFDRARYHQYNGIDTPVVPVEYLLARFVQQGTRDQEIKQLRETFSIDSDYLRKCIRVLGVESNLLSDKP